MSTVQLTIENPSISSPIRVTRETRDAATGEWGLPTAVATLPPLEKRQVVAVLNSRLAIETPSNEEIALGVANTSQTNALKVSTQSRKGAKFGDVEGTRFAHPNRSQFMGQAPQTSITVSLSAARRVLVELLPA
jgi:hypothetical protein